MREEFIGERDQKREGPTIEAHPSSVEASDRQPRATKRAGGLGKESLGKGGGGGNPEAYERSAAALSESSGGE